MIEPGISGRADELVPVLSGREIPESFVIHRDCEFRFNDAFFFIYIYVGQGVTESWEFRAAYRCVDSSDFYCIYVLFVHVISFFFRENACY